MNLDAVVPTEELLGESSSSLTSVGRREISAVKSTHVLPLFGGIAAQ
jgi:hypothetical protein